MIFKKTQMQGNYILSNGTQVLFDSKGYFETDDADVIAQIKSIYQEVPEREEVAQKELPKATPGLVGQGSSATLIAKASQTTK